MPEVRRETLAGLVGSATAEIAASVAQGGGVVATQTREITSGASASSAAGSGTIFHRFTHQGPIVLDGPDTPFVPAAIARIVAVRCDVATGSDPATIGVYIDGTLQTTLSWATAPDTLSAAMDEQLVADTSRLTVAFTAGTGSAGVSVRFEMTPG